MTATDIQAEFTSAPCVTRLTGGQLEQLIVILLWKISGGTTMSAADIQDLLNASPCVNNLMPGQKQQLIVELLWEILQGGGGGGGLVGVEGVNFAFCGTKPNQTLAIKNLDTGLFNPVHTVLPDGSQTWQIDDGVAC